MYTTMKAVGRETQPLRDSNNAIALFFILFILIGCYTTINLVIGTSINKVSTELECIARPSSGPHGSV